MKLTTKQCVEILRKHGANKATQTFVSQCTRKGDIKGELITISKADTGLKGGTRKRWMVDYCSFVLWARKIYGISIYEKPEKN